MKVFLGPREFVRLELYCAVPDKMHDSGGMQNYRRRWREQLDRRRGHLTRAQRHSATPPEERWIDLDDGGVRFVRKCLVSKKTGGWQAAVFAIFAGSPELWPEPGTGGAGTVQGESPQRPPGTPRKRACEGPPGRFGGRAGRTVPGKGSGRSCEARGDCPGGPGDGRDRRGEGTMTTHWQDSHHMPAPDGFQRSDGLRLSQDSGTGLWSIIRQPGSPPLSACPCCGKTLPNKRVAQLVADAAFPLGGPEDRRERLEEERHRLMHEYGHGPVRDGVIRDRIAEIERMLAEDGTPRDRGVA